MQIMAKAVITFLGLSAAVNLCKNLSLIGSLTQDTPPLRIILFSPFIIILLIAVVYFLILKSDWLVYKIAGSGEKLSPESEILWLAGSLRMVAILYGLVLLPALMPTILNIIISPLCIPSLINEALTFNTFPKSLTFTLYQWSYMIRHLLEAILALYLLCGWPQFIRYQLNLHKFELSIDKKLNTEENKNE